MMLSPRRPYVSPQMQRNHFDGTNSSLAADFDGLSPADAARLFSDLIKAQS